MRERREDIPPLVDHFAELLATEIGMPNPGLSEETYRALASYDYPGNVRELRNILERALIDCGGARIEPRHLRGLGEADLAVECGRDQAPAEASNQTERILAFVREHGSINNAQCRDLLGMGMHQACYVLRKLNRSGQLIQDKAKRWTRYRLP